MKNIHLLPTDKPSRLGLNNKVLDYAPLFGFELFDKNKNFRHNPVNIYITSDEEIRRGDYFISLNGDESYLDIILNNEVDDFNEYADVDWIENCKKIIITDNKDLIKDGVQAIDDEFLEWFVKNANESGVPFDICEVEDYVILPFGLPRYKLLIPQEEPKQEYYCKACGVSQDEPFGKCHESHKHCSCEIRLTEEPKQETIEEVAIKLFPRLINDPYNPTEDDNKENRDIWISGAKWQAERMCSDAECYRFLHDLMTDIKLQGLIITDDIDLKKWFKQNKKK